MIVKMDIRYQRNETRALRSFSASAALHQEQRPDNICTGLPHALTSYAYAVSTGLNVLMTMATGTATNLYSPITCLVLRIKTTLSVISDYE